MERSDRMRRTTWLVALCSLLCAARVASAQVDAQIADLNAQALEAYQALDLDTARAKLEEALGVAQQTGYGGPEVGQTYMNLGVLFVAGMNDRDQGLSAFISALCFQPDAQLDPLLSTPDVQAVFAQAQQDAAAGACGAPGGAAPQLMPTPSTAPPSVMGAGPSALDNECPPGVRCNPGGEDDSGPTDWARFFFNVQLVGAFTYVSSGLEADSRPPIQEIFAPTNFFMTDENGVMTPIDSNMVPGDLESDTFVDRNGDGNFDAADGFDFDMDGVLDNFNGDFDALGNPIPDNRFYFDDRSAWVPDGDSFDDYENPLLDIPRGRTPVPGNCDADGQPTGPLDLRDMDGNMFTSIEPTKYCVRVETPGIVNNLALRLNPGYFLSDSFAISLPIRFQFDAGQGSFSHMLIGVRGELLFSPVTAATGFPISWFFGATYGQIQAKPPPKAVDRAAPYVTSGPLGLHTGVNVRFRIHRNFGFIVSPEIDFQLPGILFNADLAGGIEAAF
jgi:hypothetical protein